MLFLHRQGARSLRRAQGICFHLAARMRQVILTFLAGRRHKAADERVPGLHRVARLYNRLPVQRVHAFDHAVPLCHHLHHGVLVDDFFGRLRAGRLRCV